MSTWNPAPGVRGQILYGPIDGPLLIARVEMAPGAVLEDAPHEGTETLISLGGSVEVAIGPSPMVWPLAAYLPPLEVPPRTTHTVKNPSKTETATLLAVLRRTVT